MTIKSKIILSLLAVVTSLVVAGSMIFVIYSATRGQITGGATVYYDWNYQVHGTVITRYTQKSLTTGFANGGDDVIIAKTKNSEKDFIEFNGWKDEEGTLKETEQQTIELTLENPWVIFELEFDIVEPIWPIATFSIDQSTSDYENIEVIVFGAPWSRLSTINPEALSSVEWNDYFGGVPMDLIDGGSQMVSLSANVCYVYYMIRVKDTSQNAHFNGNILCTIKSNE